MAERAKKNIKPKRKAKTLPKLTQKLETILPNSNDDLDMILGAVIDESEAKSVEVIKEEIGEAEVPADEVVKIEEFNRQIDRLLEEKKKLMAAIYNGKTSAEIMPVATLIEENPKVERPDIVDWSGVEGNILSPEIKPVEVKKQATAKPLRLILLFGLIAALAGLGTAAFGSLSRETVATYIGVVILMAGGIMIGIDFTKAKEREESRETQVKFNGHKPNCLNIYPREKGGIQFPVYMENPPGRMWRQYKTKNKYHINQYDPETDKLIPFVLPDKTQTIKPQEMSNAIVPVWYSDLYENEPGLWENLKWWAIVAGYGILILGIIVVG